MTSDTRIPGRALSRGVTARAARMGALSVTDLYTIGIGPSSSHTVGPMRAARAFAQELAASPGAGPVALTCTLYGSLALTGKGHGTGGAVILGLMGQTPEGVDPDAVPGILAGVAAAGRLRLDGGAEVAFSPERDIAFRRDAFHPGHANTLAFRAERADGESMERVYHSIGGGAVLAAGAKPPDHQTVLPHVFSSAAEMLAEGDRSGLSIAELMAANEDSFRPRAETEAFLDAVRLAMAACIDRGCRAEGELPGGLRVRRRAKRMYTALSGLNSAEPQTMFEWVSLWALAVNEENAAGGRVVTAPTNGAAGILPAVMRYYERTVSGADAAGLRTFLLTAAAVGFLYKKRASISAAEMGCQGEVGVACSMAAAGLAAVLGGSNAQIENAAEIGMEHNLGLTCDPIGGLVQIPCIERNAMGAVKAINAAYLALCGDGTHVVSLDAVIETMRQTGRDMRKKYKETALGGLAANVVEC